MLNKRELATIRKALPKDGYQMIAKKVGDTSSEAVRKVLSDPKRHNAQVIQTAIDLIDSYKKQQEAETLSLRSRLKEVTS